MSYTFNKPCDTFNDPCPVKDKCTDHVFLQSAISGIHSTSVNHSHLGCGSVDLVCVRKEEYKKQQG